MLLIDHTGSPPAPGGGEGSQEGEAGAEKVKVIHEGDGRHEGKPGVWWLMFHLVSRVQCHVTLASE